MVRDLFWPPVFSCQVINLPDVIHDHDDVLAFFSEKLWDFVLLIFE
jgi:hypothetical protein